MKTFIITNRFGELFNGFDDVEVPFWTSIGLSESEGFQCIIYWSREDAQKVVDLFVGKGISICPVDFIIGEQIHE